MKNVRTVYESKKTNFIESGINGSIVSRVYLSLAGEVEYLSFFLVFPVFCSLELPCCSFTFSFRVIVCQFPFLT